LLALIQQGGTKEETMKCYRWLLIFTLLILFAGVNSPVSADWVDVTEQFYAEGELITAGEAVSVEVPVINITEEFIEGQVRLVFIPADGTPIPVNATLAGEDGSDPTYYFLVEGSQEGLIEPNETVLITMEFEVTFTENMPYSLLVEINDTSIDNSVFRKKISKTPEFVSGEGAIKVMPIYVTARNTSGEYYKRSETEELVLCGTTCDENDENCETVVCAEENYARVTPIVVTYIQEEEEVLFNNVPGYDGDGDGMEDGMRYAHDVYAAVSLDDGLTWKRRNISRTSLKSSLQLENGVEYPGDSENQDLIVVGPYAFVTWVDKYCRSGDPWGMAEDGIEDIYQVTGSHKSVNYEDVTGDEDPRPDLGVRPFSCVWGARGVLDQDEDSPDYGTIVWFKAEQLSSGRRDAIRNFNAAVEPVYDPTFNNPVENTGGFAISWQEDPKGLKTGKGRGPGAGMSGACVNHKTDIWYSHINWADFAVVDTDFVSNSDGDSIQDGDGDSMAEYFCTACPYTYDPETGDEEQGIAAGTAFTDLPDTWTCPLCGAVKLAFEKDAKPHAKIAFNPPVRVTDNAVCRERTAMPIYGHTHTEGYVSIDGDTCDYYYEGGTNNQPLLWDELPDDWACPKCGGTKIATFKEEVELVKYRNEGAPYCEAFADNPRVDGDGNLVAPEDDAYEVAYYTSDESHALDGNTGASRANLSLVNWQGETIALMAYEETKGVGAGSDKEAAAMEQLAPYPLVQMEDGIWEAGATNSDCRSCHYNNIVPRDRLIPVPVYNPNVENWDGKKVCEQVKGGIWKEDLIAYFPYAGYSFETEAPVTDDELSEAGVAYDENNRVKCVKFQDGWGMYPKDYAQTYGENTYYNLPDHMPGWHQEALDCTSCHLPYGKKDLDMDGVADRYDNCPGTALDDLSTLNTIIGSSNCGCIESQDPDDSLVEDEPDRYRHGKNVYYHHFAFNSPDEIAISHGDQINGLSRDVVGTDEDGNDILWTAPGSYDEYENARRVRVVPNAILDETDSDALTLGLLYKEGKDGQGSPADAVLRLFKNGFSVDNMTDQVLNLSSSTPYLFQDPLTAGNEDGTGDNPAGDGTGDMVPNQNTPKIDHFYWTHANLNDPTGYWYDNGNGDKVFSVDDGYTPDTSGNPFENVFSTRLSIHGDTVLAGFAYCVNWSAGRKATDHYDFYIRVSEDAGENWSLPVNVSKLKNHEASVSDCRVQLTPPTTMLWNINGQGIPFSQTGAPALESKGDFNDSSRFFVGVGTRVNQPQPGANETELEENEIFLDVFYSQGEMTSEGLQFETYQKENPKYVEGSEAYLDTSDEQTSEPCAGFDANGNCIPNEPNPAHHEFVEEFDWLAKGDATQGDLQMVSNPMGSKLYTIWEQELPITEEDGQQHFQGADVWFRKVFYEEPSAMLDVNQDGEINWLDGREILRNIGTTAYEQEFLWEGDFLSDNRITGKDFNLWKKEYLKQKVSSSRSRWTVK
jgi:rubredoxin